MKFHYYQDTDSLYIDLSEKKAFDSKEIVRDVVLDLDENGNIVGIDIDHASQVVNLKKIEAKGIPTDKISFA